jgi:hypothetical protein
MLFDGDPFATGPGATGIPGEIYKADGKAVDDMLGAPHEA